MIQTRQHLRCHRRVEAGVELVTTGRISERYDKRGRTYVDVETTVVDRRRTRRTGLDVGGLVHAGGDARIGTVSESRTRTLAITEELVRAYSRRGNFHSDPTLSADLALPGLVAQGVQAAGPAYGVLLDAWGEEFLAHGEIEMRFVGIVLAGDTVDAAVDVDVETATFEVRQHHRRPNGRCRNGAPLRPDVRMSRRRSSSDRAVRPTCARGSLRRARARRPS